MRLFSLYKNLFGSIIFKYTGNLEHYDEIYQESLTQLFEAVKQRQGTEKKPIPFCKVKNFFIEILKQKASKLNTSWINKMQGEEESPLLISNGKYIKKPKKYVIESLNTGQIAALKEEAFLIKTIIENTRNYHGEAFFKRIAELYFLNEFKPNEIVKILYNLEKKGEKKS